MKKLYFRGRFGYKWEANETKVEGHDETLVLYVYSEYHPAYVIPYHDWTEIDRM